MLLPLAALLIGSLWLRSWQRATAALRSRVTRAEAVLFAAREQLDTRTAGQAADLQRTNDALLMRERRFRALIERGTDGIAVIDASNHILYLSPAVATIEGYTDAELTGRNGIEHTHPDDVPLVHRAVEELMANPGKPIPVLWRRRHKQGHWIWLEGVATNLLDDPAVAGIVTNYRDVSDRKRAEEQIAQLNADLERRVAERTAQLEAANKELDSFSSSISHDLRAPLRHVQGFVQLLDRELDGTLSPKAQHYLRTIKDSAGEMGQLIDDLLAFSRTSRTELRETTVDLDALVAGIVRRLQAATNDRQIAWHVAPLPAIRGDASMIRQVFSNLLDNAVKYSRGREPAVIELGCASLDAGRATLFVRDNGAGFDMAYVHKLFGVFQRLHPSDQFEGTGIGLANVQRIISKHGGRVWAEGAVDKGATFYLTLEEAFPSPPPFGPAS